MTAHARAGILSRLAGKFPGHRPTPGHCGGYDGDLLESAALDLQDDGSRMDPFPRYDADAEWVRARRDRPAEETHEPPLPQDWYGHGPTRFDNFPPPAPRSWAPEAEPMPRPLFTPLPDRPAPPPLPDGVVARMARLAYPPYGAPPERWAAVMRQVGAATNTATAYEMPAAWGGSEMLPASVTPALDVAIVTGADFGLHRLALEAGTAVAA